MIKMENDIVKVTRKYKWWRKIHPKNIIGFFLRYGSCHCGNTWWRLRKRVHKSWTMTK
jgi:hypothetical protein